MAKKILIVDDSQAEIGLFKMIVSAKTDYDAVFAQDGVEALEFFLKEKFDLVFTDLYMPNMNGIMLLKEIRKRDKKIPVIGCSGAFFEDDDEDIMEMDFTDMLHKPFKDKEMVDLFDKYLKS